MYLFNPRLNTSVTPAQLLPRFCGSVSAELVSDFCQVNTLVNESPVENRLVAFTCNESYHVLPSGDHRSGPSRTAGRAAAPAPPWSSRESPHTAAC